MCHGETDITARDAMPQAVRLRDSFYNPGPYSNGPESQPCLGSYEVTAMKTNQDVMRRETWKSSTLGVVAVAVVALLGAGTAPREARAGQAGAASSTDRLLAGAIDFHTHGLPDMEERTVDSADLARMARDRGMRGIVPQESFRSDGNARVHRAQTGAGLRDIRRHRPQSHGGRHQRARGRAHDSGHRWLGTRRLVPDARRRARGRGRCCRGPQPGTALRECVEGWGATARGHRCHCRDRGASTGARDGSLVAGGEPAPARRGKKAGRPAHDGDPRSLRDEPRSDARSHEARRLHRIRL